jgi:hypothetical protein
MNPEADTQYPTDAAALEAFRTDPPAFLSIPCKRKK